MTSRTQALPDAAPAAHPARLASGAVAALAAERRRVADYVELTKPRVVAMVLVTTLVGFYVGSAGPPEYGRLLQTLLGTMLAASGTLALNQFIERDVDARMRRTRGRPLPDGRLAPGQALVFGLLLVVAGVGHLALAVDPRCGLVTGLTVLLYLGVYTPLKQVTPLAMVIGAVPGALPPVTGWVAARGGVGVGALVLFAILFLWQLPHTLAIARLYRDDYARAGIRVLPVVDPGGASAERQMVTGCLALLAVGLLPTVVGLAGGVYFVGAFVLGAVFLACALAQALAPSVTAARRLLLASVSYLPLLLLLMALDKAG